MMRLIEPKVLVAAKDYLLDEDAETGYAVVDARFQRETWGDAQIDRTTRQRLCPINALRLHGLCGLSSGVRLATLLTAVHPA